MPPLARRIPTDVWAALSTTQRDALLAALEPRNHPIDLRVSIPLLNRRCYITVLGGRERRALDRLAQEGQLATARQLAVYALLVSALLAPIGALLLATSLVSRLAGVDSLEPPILALHEMLRHP